jgi:hypothetical protein
VGGRVPFEGAVSWVMAVEGRRQGVPEGGYRFLALRSSDSASGELMHLMQQVGRTEVAARGESRGGRVAASIAVSGVVILVAGAIGIIALSSLLVGMVAAATLVSQRGRTRGDGADLRPSVWEARGMVLAELERSRRYNHAFCIIRVPSMGWDSSRGKAPRPSHEGEVVTLTATLRQGDVVWTEGQYTYALLPETDTLAARLLLQRVSAGGVPLPAGSVRVAAFPADGLTIPALRSVLDAVPGRAKERSAS